MTLQIALTAPARCILERLNAAQDAAQVQSWPLAARLYHEAARMLEEDGEMNLARYYEARADYCASVPDAA